MPQVISDQAANGFVLAQTAFIEREIVNIVYGDIQYPFLIPVDTTAPDWAKSVTFFSGDKFGAAQWISGNADDVPRAGADMAKYDSFVYTAGVGYGYGLEEVQQAMMIGVPLESMRANAARRAAEEFIDGALLRGDTRKNLSGLISYPGITAITAPTGGWATATAAQIIADLNAGLMPTFAGTYYTSIADTVLLPFEKLQVLAQTQLPNTTENVLAWIERNNLYTQQTGNPLTIRGTTGLLTAGAGSTARAVFYKRSPDVLKAHIPMPHRFLDVYRAGPIRWEVPGLFRLGGLDIRQPQNVRYLDGI